MNVKQPRITVVLLVLLMLITMAAGLVACGKADFKITFNVDGNVHHTISVNDKDKIEMPTVPTKAGFTFAGWFFNKDVWIEAVTVASLERIDIPASVTEIDEAIVEFCNKLTAINVSIANAKYLSNDGNLYRRDSDSDNREMLWLVSYAPGKTAVEFTVPDSIDAADVWGIESYAFEYVRHLEKIVIPETVVYINAYAINSNGRMTIYAERTAAPEGWLPWDETAHDIVWGCMQNVKDNAGNAYVIVDGVLYKLKNGEATIESLVVPAEFVVPEVITHEDLLGEDLLGEEFVVKDINFGLIRNMKDITKMVLSSSVVNLYGDQVNVSSLVSIEVAAANQKFKSIDGNLYSKDGTILIMYAAGKTDAVFTVPSGVKNIATEAIFGSKYLTTIIMQDGVEDIYLAIRDCPNLGKVVLPASLVTLGAYPIRGCGNLKNIEISDDNQLYKSIDGNVYSKDGRVLIRYATGKTEEKFVVPSHVTSIGKAAMWESKNLTEIVIQTGVISIGENAFEDCVNLKKITIPTGVTSIAADSFRECHSLESVIIPTSVTSIGAYAFFGCYSLENLIIPSSVTSIGESAFINCFSMLSIIIPLSVTHIEDDIASYGGMVILVEAESKPGDWSDYWNSMGNKVVWDYKNR